MVNLHRRITFIAVFSVAVLFFVQSAQAVSLGSVLKNDFSETRTGESAVFTALFWNVDKDPYYVELYVSESPEDWNIVILPDKFTLDSSIGTEQVALPYLEENVNALPVKIFVKPSEDTKNIENFITIGARNALPGSGNLNFFQERKFTFQVNVINVIESEYDDFQSQVEVRVSDEIIIGSEVVEESIPEKEDDFLVYIIFAIIFVGILAVSVAIYRYA